MNQPPSLLRIVLWMALVTGTALAGRQAVLAEDPPGDKPVTVTVDFGDGFQKTYTQIPWTKGMTVLQAMEAAAKHPRGIRFEYRGKNETAFLTEIDQVKNEGVGRNWVYRVNEKLGDRSFGVFVLQPGDIVLWRFGGYNAPTR